MARASRLVFVVAAGLSALAVAGLSTSQAAVFNLSLTGQVANFVESQFDSGGTHVDEFDLALSGLDPSNAITVSQGDEIDSTVTLDSTYTIAASQLQTNLLHFLFGSNFPAEPTEVGSGTFTFYDGVTPVLTLNFGSSTFGALVGFAFTLPPNNGAFTFDSFTDDYTITNLATPATLDSSEFTYQLLSTAVVPEPATWVMMLIGFGGLGALVGMAKRRSVAATLAGDRSSS